MIIIKPSAFAVMSPYEKPHVYIMMFINTLTYLDRINNYSKNFYCYIYKFVYYRYFIYAILDFDRILIRHYR